VRRVVVTGLGTVSPCGLDVEQTWESVLCGRSGIGPITRFDASSWAVRIAGEVRGFDPAAHMHRRLVKRLDPYAQYAVVAATEAVVDAGFGVDEDLGDRAGVYVGSGIGGIGEIASCAQDFPESGPKGLTPFFIPRSLTNLATGHIAMRHGARGPSLCISTACATGNHSIGEAMRVIRSGDADVIIAGGSEGAVVPLAVAGFMVMRALSQRNDTPATASRPFDVDRDGFVLSEGAGILVLEEYEHAKARGARIYCEVMGYGLTNDAHHMTAPPPGHAGAVRCMNQALKSAGINGDAIEYVNAHGTSTPANDAAETTAIKSVFGEHARKLMVSSTKSVTGHLLGAAGGLESVLTAKALFHGVVPATVTLEQPDPECDLDYVPKTAREVPIRAAMNNSFGFGGTNASLVFGRV